MSSVFHRASDPLVAVRASGSRVYDDLGNEYIDAASGALVSSLGHGDASVVAALQQAARLDYVHPSVFTSEPLEAYASAVASLAPVQAGRVYPTSGGAESIETALKLARAYHLARGEDRDVVISRRQSYHGNTLGALRLSGRPHLQEAYAPWLVGSVHVPEVYEYRCPSPSHPNDCGAWHADQLDQVIRRTGPGRVAAFFGESIGGATLAAAVPGPGYWEAIERVCRDHGVLLVIDEVMTGFGRTGRWFAIEEWDVSPDIVVSGKGAGAGYWPLGLCIASGPIHDVVRASGGFVHGYTFSHSPIGAAVGLAVIERIEEEGLVVAAEDRGRMLMSVLEEEISGFQAVGDIRGRGLLVGVEFVADRDTKAPFRRAEGFVEGLTSAARGLGLLVYPSVGCANGTDGDSILIGPPLNVSEDDIDQIVVRLVSALHSVQS